MVAADLSLSQTERNTLPSSGSGDPAAAGSPLPLEGRVFLSVCDSDKSAATILAQRLHSLGFSIYATRGTATALTSLGIPVNVVNKVFQGEPNVVNLIESGEIVLVINTPFGRVDHQDDLAALDEVDD